MYLVNSTALPDICLLPQDHEALLDLICAAPLATAGITLLWQELQRAAIIAPEDATRDLVRLRSIVTFTDLRTDRHRAVQLVRPGQATARPRLSVASPNGAALIGLRAGDTFAWRCGEGRQRVLRVDDVAPDPGAPQRQQTERAAARRRRIAELLSLT